MFDFKNKGIVATCPQGHYGEVMPKDQVLGLWFCHSLCCCFAIVCMGLRYCHSLGCGLAIVWVFFIVCFVCRCYCIGTTSTHLYLIIKYKSFRLLNSHKPNSAILTGINDKTNALLADFGTSDEVLASLLFGKVKPTGKMPFELPSSWESVLKQLEDVPYDSENPLYTFGHGLSY